MTWTNAKAYCEGLGGHLATITSAEEQAFIEQLLLVGQKNQYWLGGTDEQQEGVWTWVTGEPWSYTNWDPGQPDNYHGLEDYLQIYNKANGIRFKWNDIPVDNAYSGDPNSFYIDNIGFICEWEHGPGHFMITQEYSIFHQAMILATRHFM